MAVSCGPARIRSVVPKGDSKLLEEAADKNCVKRETVYHKVKTPLQQSFSAKSMEEVYQDLSMVKQAANLTKQEILEFVADHALFWLQVAYKKSHGDELSAEACHVEEARVTEAVKGLKADQSRFPQQIESITKPRTDEMATENKRETAALQDHSEDHFHQNIIQSKHLLKGSITGRPRNKKTKTKEEDDDDNDGNSGVQSPHKSNHSETNVADVDGDDNGNSITAYLSGFLKFLQTIDGGNFKENEAFENTHHVRKMIEAMDSSTHTIDCLLYHKNILHWIESQAEAKLPGHIIQEYLLILERFYDFLSSGHLPVHPPQFSDESNDLVNSLKLMCQTLKKGAVQIAFENRWKRPLTEPVCNRQEMVKAARTVSHIHSNVEEKYASTRTSSNKCNLKDSIVMNPRRKKWEKKDVELLCKHFRKNPGKAAIRKKMKDDEELEKLQKREGLERCYEKVKTLYKKRKS